MFRWFPVVRASTGHLRHEFSRFRQDDVSKIYELFYVHVRQYQRYAITTRFGSDDWSISNQMIVISKSSSR